MELIQTRERDSPMLRRLFPLLLLLLFLFSVSGCSRPVARPELTADQSYEKLAGEIRPLPYRVAIAPLEKPPVVRPTTRRQPLPAPLRALESDLVSRVVADHPYFPSGGVLVVPERPDPVEELLGEAREKDSETESAEPVEEADPLDRALTVARGTEAELLLQMKLAEWQCTFEGRSDAWVTNMILWWLLFFPTHFVDDEEFGFDARLDVAVYSVKHGNRIWSDSVSAHTEVVLDDFDRGLDFWNYLFGIFTVPASMDRAMWRNVSRYLVPTIRTRLQLGLMERLNEFRAYTETDGFPYRLQGQEPPVAFGILLGSTGSRESTTGTLRTALLRNESELGFQQRTVFDLRGRRFAQSRIEDVFRSVALTAKETDSVLLYYDGPLRYVVDEEEEATLLIEMRDDANEPVEVPLAELLNRLSTLQTESQLVILARPIQGMSGDWPKAVLDYAGFEGRAVLAAFGRGETGDASTFVQHLIRGISGAADADEDEAISLAELVAFVGEQRDGAVLSPELLGSGAERILWPSPILPEEQEEKE